VKLRYRVVAALLLLSALGVLFVHAGATGDQRWPYPDPDDLATDYDAHVGERTFLFGTVRTVDGARMEIAAESESGVVELRVSGVETAVEPGGTVQVYGTLEPDHRLTADRVVVVNDSWWAELYKYVTSAVGALGFLVVFFRFWRIDTETWALEARDG